MTETSDSTTLARPDAPEIPAAKERSALKRTLFRVPAALLLCAPFASIFLPTQGTAGEWITPVCLLVLTVGVLVAEERLNVLARAATRFNRSPFTMYALTAFAFNMLAVLSGLSGPTVFGVAGLQILFLVVVLRWLLKVAQTHDFTPKARVVKERSWKVRTLLRLHAAVFICAPVAVLLGAAVTHYRGRPFGISADWFVGGVFLVLLPIGLLVAAERTDIVTRTAALLNRPRQTVYVLAVLALYALLGSIVLPPVGLVGLLVVLGLAVTPKGHRASAIAWTVALLLLTAHPPGLAVVILGGILTGGTPIPFLWGFGKTIHFHATSDSDGTDRPREVVRAFMKVFGPLWLLFSLPMISYQIWGLLF